MADLTVQVADHDLDADWVDQNAALRDALAAASPVGGRATRWGAELYVGVPLDAEAAATATIVDPGTVAYWPTGDALCLFWGPTPASDDDRPQAAGPVAPLARLRDIDPLAAIDGDATLTVRV
ncbi:hypothetical protein HARCEL1_10360 [Halococcoides cellulosivorans]|uniref:Cyclophilin TM1367-like domain-containing protein n=2 Tax=Halococcoides cellulosivorans TaxID=1679096 RepID=A0A2R4X4H9_9EURY|nr:hypothetical protein HARCEL1_10360 [Halococcoides cellulosivorans]